MCSAAVGGMKELFRLGPETVCFRLAASKLSVGKENVAELDAKDDEDLGELRKCRSTCQPLLSTTLRALCFMKQSAPASLPSVNRSIPKINNGRLSSRLSVDSVPLPSPIFSSAG